jgi:hypothetical protein
VAGAAAAFFGVFNENIEILLFLSQIIQIRHRSWSG